MVIYVVLAWPLNFIRAIWIYSSRSGPFESTDPKASSLMGVTLAAVAATFSRSFRAHSGTLTAMSTDFKKSLPDGKGMRRTIKNKSRPGVGSDTKLMGER